jgi:3D (Asp-Asp-Asp) domain-containing protein
MTGRLATRVGRCLLVAGALAVGACAAFREPPVQVERALVVTATAYNAVPEQTVGDPERGAWGDRLAPGSRAIAVSQDLLELGLRRGTQVRIEGLPGEWTVLDKMPSRWKRRIDIFMGHDVGSARQWGKRKVRIRWTEQQSARPSPQRASR